jgi:3'-phosphoadenosine 5'-phosphosulfate sulfotransferase (PAPS reductase)/FAD synthetase
MDLSLTTEAVTDVVNESGIHSLVFYPMALPQNELPAAPNLADYDRAVVFFSGGKDSQAAFLHLLESGFDRSKIELHHHLVDGREGSTLMDWPVTDSYCEAFAKAFGVKYVRSWKVGCFEGEMLRQGQRTAPISFEQLDGSISTSGGERGELSTRRKFPQTSADLSVRWCSAYLKVDVGARVLTKEERFLKGKTLVVTGERAEESTSRARYKTFERHRAHRTGKRVERHIDHWRAVHSWSEQQVWDILSKYMVNPHPAYKIGFGRCSCRTCIFASPNQWSTVQKYMPEAFEAVAKYETEFGLTIARKNTIAQTAARGTAYEVDLADVAQANSLEYYDSVIVDGVWTLPMGAFGESAGPT